MYAQTADAQTGPQGAESQPGAEEPGKDQGKKVEDADFEVVDDDK